MKLLINLCIIGLSLLLTSCGGDNTQDLQDFVKQTQIKYQGVIEPLPQMNHYQSYKYQVDKMRDPFRPATSQLKSLSPVKPNNSIQPNLKRTREELENFTLDSLSMVGVLHNNGERWAIVRSPENTIYRVRKGNYLGRNNGRIISIDETRINLREIVADGLGGWIERANKIILSE